MIRGNLLLATVMYLWLVEAPVMDPHNFASKHQRTSKWHIPTNAAVETPPDTSLAQSTVSCLKSVVMQIARCTVEILTRVFQLNRSTATVARQQLMSEQMTVPLFRLLLRHATFNCSTLPCASDATMRRVNPMKATTNLLVDKIQNKTKGIARGLKPVSVAEHNSEEQQLDVLKTYLNPSIFGVIMLVGLVGNGTLLLMFARHGELRTAANTMILNLAVSDLLNLSISAPLFCMFHYPHSSPGDVPLCRLFIAGRHFLLCVSALSVVALSVQRFCITSPSLQKRQTSAWTPSTSPVLYVLTVWSLALLIALPMYLHGGVYEYLCSTYTGQTPTRVLFLLYSVLFCALLPSLMLFFSTLTARRLRRSAEDMPGEIHQSTHIQLRKRSARVVTCLALVFVLTYFPLWLWAVVVYWTDPDRQSATVLVSEYVTKYLLFANGCFNPIALYIASATFRRLFRRYLCCSTEQQSGEGTSSATIQHQISE